ncbi:MAG: polysaccharide deacetylase family protein [Oscillospiraceae bacterium]|nr:polysaccharide deacetylase family protein [Oscillospiraceae bacterium]
MKGRTLMEKLIALSFDDGPNTTATVKTLDVLEKHGVRASFFLISNNINEESTAMVRRALSLGCDIQNHSRTHCDMTKLTAEQIADEIRYTDEKITEITGKVPTFFRPPYICVNDTMYDTIDKPFICGIGSEDWEHDITAEEVYRRALERACPGAIMLLHDSPDNDHTYIAVDMLIPELKKQGYTFVTVPEIFERSGIVPQTGKMYSTVYDHK